MTYYITSVKFLCYKIFTVIEKAGAGQTDGEVMTMKQCRTVLRRSLLGAAAAALLSVSVWAAPAYTMTVQGGFVAVWDHGSESWCLRTRIPVGQLPEADQALLRRGLALSDGAALTRALEDFCS